MRNGVVSSIEDPLFAKCARRVVIHYARGTDSPLRNPENVFHLNSTCLSFVGDESYHADDTPFAERRSGGLLVKDISDIKFVRDDVVAFRVDMRRGGRLLLAGEMSFLGKVSGDDWSDGFDGLKSAAVMWTDRERFELACGPWMTVDGRAVDVDEFAVVLRRVAETELRAFDAWKCGHIYWFETDFKTGAEKRAPCLHRFRPGVDDVPRPYFLTSVADEIDFPRGDGLEVFADAMCRELVGQEYDIPEYVVCGRNGTFLSEYTFDKDGVASSAWTGDVGSAVVFNRFEECWRVAMHVLGCDVDIYKVCRDKDDVIRELADARRIRSALGVDGGTGARG